MVEALSRGPMEYTGKIYPKPGEIAPSGGHFIFPYIPSSELVDIVNLAIYLDRPLLLKGEPGCGKTQLAYALAYELNLPLETWHIKSSSRARDGLYIYDAVGRLRDAQLAASGQTRKVESLNHYIKWGALGRAFQNKQKTVVLIDEIDKADIDFPNDLLLELDEQRFLIEETDEKIQANEPPIIIITSNDEKDLPDAFLRRCLFHYIEFPNQEQLLKIVKSRFITSPESLLEKIVDRFLELREEMRRDKGEAGKKISTSELMDWILALNRYPQSEILKKLDKDILCPGVLLKSWDDYRRYASKSSRGSL